jgi:signal transduction histidine kinase
MFSSLRSRLWLSYALLIAAALGIVTAALFLSMLRNPLLYRQTTERLKAVQTGLLQRDGQDISTAAKKAARVFDVRVLLYSKDKQVIFDTSAASEAPLPFPSRRLAGSLPMVRDENKKAWLYVTEQLSDGTFLAVAAPRPRFSIVALFTDDFLPLILQSGLIALLLSLAAAYFVARWVADPLQKVILAARTMPLAEVEPIEAQGPREVRELTQAFNSMAARVQASRKSQRDFVANVSHELKTPLTSIQGFAQALLDGTAGDSQTRQQAAQTIYDEALRMHRMVLDLLDLAKLDSGTAGIVMSPVNLPALLNAVREKFAPQSQRAGVEILVEVSSLPSLVADGDRLAQVFANLVDNALKFTPQGGRIWLKAAEVDGGVLVNVTDTGAGISDQAQAHIFERFYRVEEARNRDTGGTGLGLAIVKSLVTTMNGKVTLVSPSEKGCIFTLSFPLVE